MNLIESTLFWCVLQVTLVSTVTLVVYGIMGWINQAARPTVALFGLLLIGALSLASFLPLPSWFAAFPVSSVAEVEAVDVLENEIEAVSPATEVTDSDILETGSVPTVMKRETELESPTKAFWSALTQVTMPPPEEPVSQQRSVSFYFVLLMIGSALFGFAKLLLGIIAVARLRKTSTLVDDVKLCELRDVVAAQLSCRRTIQIRQSDQITSAATVGWRKPIIFLPAQWTQWSQSEKNVVLAHEIAHIRQDDFFKWLLAQLGVALHFYHPLVHWISQYLHAEQEMSADEAAAACVKSRQQYLKTLADMAIRQADCTIAWPARMFLPTRKTFLRRIEMLRGNHRKRTRVNALQRAFCVLAMLLFGIGIAGLRTPWNSVGGAGDVSAAEVDSNALARLSEAKLSYIPQSANFVISIRPAYLYSTKPIKAIKKAFVELGGDTEEFVDKLEAGVSETLGVEIEDIDQLTFAFSPTPQLSPEPQFLGAIMHLQHGLDLGTLPQSVQIESAGTYLHEGTTYQIFKNPAEFTICQVTDKVLIYTLDQSKLATLLEREPGHPAQLPWQEQWQRVSQQPLAIFMNTESIGSIINQSPSQQPPMWSVIKPLFSDAKFVLLGGTVKKKINFQAYGICSTESGATRVTKTVSSLLSLAEVGHDSMMANLSQAGMGPTPQTQFYSVTGESIGEVLKSAKVKQDGKVVKVSASVGTDIEKQMLVMAPAISAARVAAFRAQSMNNLKQIAVAMFNYHDVYGHFPSATVLGPDGKTVHSWRIAILPFIEQQELYKQYRLDEAWNSPHNSQVTANIPPVFMHPMDAKGTTNTSYMLLTGELTPFNGTRKVELKNITDGLSNTILAVELKIKKHWAQPVDLPYVKAETLKSLRGWYDDGTFAAARCDGSVQNITPFIVPEVFERLAEHQDGQPIPLKIDRPGTQPETSLH